MTHLAKIVYFGTFLSVADVSVFSATTIGVALGAAILGTSLARPVLERLSDHGFRNYTRYIIMAIGTVYLIKGVSGYIF